jgi:hypothetical protein
MLQVADIVQELARPGLPHDKAANRFRRLVAQGVITPAATLAGQTGSKLYPPTAPDVVKVLFLLCDQAIERKEVLKGIWNYLLARDPSADASRIEQIQRAVAAEVPAYMNVWTFWRQRDGDVHITATHMIDDGRLGDQEGEPGVPFPSDEHELVSTLAIDLGVLLKRGD